MASVDFFEYEPTKQDKVQVGIFNSYFTWKNASTDIFETERHFLSVTMNVTYLILGI